MLAPNFGNGKDLSSFVQVRSLYLNLSMELSMNWHKCMKGRIFISIISFGTRRLYSRKALLRIINLGKSCHSKSFFFEKLLQ